MRISFYVLCYFHAAIDLLTGGAMLADLDATARAAHGAQATELFSKHPEAQLIIRTSQSLVAILLLIIALLLIASSSAKDLAFQRRFCKIALLIHGLMIFYRIQYQSQLPMLRKDIPGQLVGDAIFAGTWVGFLMTNPSLQIESESKQS